MTESPPRIGGLDVQGLNVQGLGDPEDPIVLLIGPPERLSADGRRWVAGPGGGRRHVLLAPLDEADGRGGGRPARPFDRTVVPAALL
ncbi:Flavin reductase like domain protein, partial [Streptomyces coelicoflavus ZG0656]